MLLYTHSTGEETDSTVGRKLFQCQGSVETGLVYWSGVFFRETEPVGII